MGGFPDDTTTVVLGGHGKGRAALGGRVWPGRVMKVDEGRGDAVGQDPAGSGSAEGGRSAPNRSSRAVSRVLAIQSQRQGNGPAFLREDSNSRF